jgi:CelD/BcsL family acetyltransferase involved in cellulose biosynthesis
MPSTATVGLLAESAFEKNAELRLEIVSDYSAFLDLKPLWDRLVEAASIGHPFLEHDWVRAWWDCFGANRGYNLHILIVKSGNEPIAIAPLIFTTARMYGLRVRRLGFFYNDHVPRAGFIVSKRSEDVHRAIWKYLIHSGGWDLVQLCQLPEDSETLSAMSELARGDRYPAGVWQSSAAPHIPIRDSWSYYFGGLDAKFRSNLRNRFKRLSAIGPLKIEAIRGRRGLEDALKSGFELEAAAWKGQAGTAITCHRDIRNFYEAFAWRAAERGWLRLQFLNVSATRVAFDYTLEYNNRLFVLKSGYDPDHAAYSPTNLLVSRVLEDAFQQKFDRYDFLGDAAEWKSRWTKHVVRHYWLFIFPRSFKGRLLQLLKFRIIPLLKVSGRAAGKVAVSVKRATAPVEPPVEKS